MVIEYCGTLTIQVVVYYDDGTIPSIYAAKEITVRGKGGRVKELGSKMATATNHILPFTIYTELTEKPIVLCLCVHVHSVRMRYHIQSRN